jgi:UDP-N-acetylglucosamine 4-epimerase
VDELFAKNFSDTYGIETVGLRYFNVFGRRQDPDGAYAAVIPKFVASLMRHESPQINGDGTYSRDFTYIDNVIQANQLAATVPSKEFKENLRQYSQKLPNAGVTHPEATISEVFNVAYGERASLNELGEALKKQLSNFDRKIKEVGFKYGSKRAGDVPHSHASIRKGEAVLGYSPQYSLEKGLEEACTWYWENLR